MVVRICLFVAVIAASCVVDTKVPGIQGSPPSDAGAPDAIAEPDVPCDVEADCLPLPNCFISATCDSGSCAYQAKDCSVTDVCATGFCDVDTGNCETSTEALEGTSCGTSECGPVGDCVVEVSDNVCASAGTQETECVNDVCRSGACIVETESGPPAACQVDKTGAECVAEQCIPIGGCDIDLLHPCSSTGIQKLTCTRSLCQGTSCIQEQREETIDCDRGNVDGDICYRGFGRGWGNCQGGSCD